MEVRELFGLLTAFVILAGLTVAITGGKDTALIMQAGTNGFANMTRAATGK
jgi:hypothetical protein